MPDTAFTNLVCLLGLGAFAALGIVMIRYAEPLGQAFCRSGKRIFSDSLLIPEELIDQIHDEDSAAPKMRFMGVVNLMSSTVLFMVWIAIVVMQLAT